MIYASINPEKFESEKGSKLMQVSSLFCFISFFILILYNFVMV
jgi:hypothetical protein